MQSTTCSSTGAPLGVTSPGPAPAPAPAPARAAAAPIAADRLRLGKQAVDAIKWAVPFRDRPTADPVIASSAPPDRPLDDADPTGADGPPVDDGPVDDASVVKALCAGDEQVFTDVVRRLTPDLLRLVRVYVPSPAVAEEVVQETWLVVMKGVDRFEGRSSLRTWIIGIAIKIARRSGARERRALPFSSTWTAQRAPAEDPARFHPAADPAGRGGYWVSLPYRWDVLPEERLHAAEVLELIKTIVAGLPRRQREVITARDVLGLDAAEVGALFGLTDGNQRVLLHRARSRVRLALENYFADETNAPAPTQPGTERASGGPS